MHVRYVPGRKSAIYIWVVYIVSESSACSKTTRAPTILGGDYFSLAQNEIFTEISHKSYPLPPPKKKNKLIFWGRGIRLLNGVWLSYVSKWQHTVNSMIERHYFIAACFFFLWIMFFSTTAFSYCGETFVHEEKWKSSNRIVSQHQQFFFFKTPNLSSLVGRKSNIVFPCAFVFFVLKKKETSMSEEQSTKRTKWANNSTW